MELLEKCCCPTSIPPQSRGRCPHPYHVGGVPYPCHVGGAPTSVMWEVPPPQSCGRCPHPSHVGGAPPTPMCIRMDGAGSVQRSRAFYHSTVFTGCDIFTIIIINLWGRGTRGGPSLREATLSPCCPWYSKPLMQYTIWNRPHPIHYSDRLNVAISRPTIYVSATGHDQTHVQKRVIIILHTPSPITASTLHPHQSQPVQYTLTNHSQYTTPSPITASTLFPHQSQPVHYSLTNHSQYPTPSPITASTLLPHQSQPVHYSLTNHSQYNTPSPITASTLHPHQSQPVSPR